MHLTSVSQQCGEKGELPCESSAGVGLLAGNGGPAATVWSQAWASVPRTEVVTNDQAVMYIKGPGPPGT